MAGLAERATLDPGPEEIKLARDAARLHRLFGVADRGRINNGADSASMYSAHWGVMTDGR